MRRIRVETLKLAVGQGYMARTILAVHAWGLWMTAASVSIDPEHAGRVALVGILVAYVMAELVLSGAKFYADLEKERRA